jgi:hypothetical protein
MPFPKNSKPVKNALTNAAKAIDDAAPKVFSALTKDHAHTSTWLMLIEKPTSGFWAWIAYWIKCFFVASGVALARVILIILLYILLFAFLAFVFFGFGSK